jgi:hypothetical protein
MGKFEDQLLGDLMRKHGPALATAQRPAPSRNKRPVWIAAGAVALAGAVTVTLAVVDGGAPAAFAVNQNADGSITVSIKDIAAIDPANKELERLGVPIRAVPTRPDCPLQLGTGASAGGGGEQVGGPTGNPQPPPDKDLPKPEFKIDLRPGGGVTIERSALTPGANIALGVFTDPSGTVGSMSFAKIEGGPMPTCLPSDTPPGMPTPSPTPTN